MESTGDSSAQAQALINWELAASTAARLAPAGPPLGASEIGAAVENLRLMADISVPHVHDITGLEAARDLRDSSVLVVDRASWARANTQSFAVMLKPAMEKMLESRRGAMSPGALAVSGAITGSQLGAVLAFLSSKVLGQYDPFSALAEDSTAPAAGRLLLVAPNIIQVERELNVAPEDFRLWVCLHEQTHRVQFAAAYTGQGGLVAHECILDLRPMTKETGVTVEDVAKRLIDYGLHAPTMSFPVAGTLMVEPTESEDLGEIDRFIDAMIRIRSEIDRVAAGEWPADDNPLVNAPHTAEMLTREWTHPYTRDDACYPDPACGA